MLGFLGLAGYYRRFIPDYSSIAAPLTDLTKLYSPCKTVWNDQCDSALRKLKALLCISPILQSSDFGRPFILQTDASERCIGAILSQCNEHGHDHPTDFFSRMLLPRKEKYSTIEKECLAIKLGVEAFCAFLLGGHFAVQMDHRALEWMQILKEKNARLSCWVLTLQPCSFTVEHRKDMNQSAGTLSTM